jgi:cob(I)alamin adenosyltransferase
MKIYTRSGDQGDTSLLGGARVAKDVLRIETYGTVDELNCVLGLVRAQGVSERIDQVLDRVQNELLSVGAELASPDPVARGTRIIGPQHVAHLEADIDEYQAVLPPLKQFILPGGALAAATLHVARAVCRRAERHLVALARQDGRAVSLSLIAYLNRLSDLLFVLARAANQEAGREDTLWRK